ncbi:MAG: EscU/YscU/HrcU family type III secretion system export apparatus switch protein [Hyphomicrobiaceae bacterium]|nr:EscU/YscU/HrcU family type III secretion system export apparatus switch protein [Hyphomicrobiaceae bacterium]
MSGGDDTAVAVALEYEVGTREAPRVTAKGYGVIAEQIIALAAEHGVTIESNAHLVEALSGVELDDRIPMELYEAVAEVIAFVLRASGKVD